MLNPTAHGEQPGRRLAQGVKQTPAGLKALRRGFKHGAILKESRQFARLRARQARQARPISEHLHFQAPKLT